MLATSHDWKNQMFRTHRLCLVDGQDDPLLQEGYAAVLLLDSWYRERGQYDRRKSDDAWEKTSPVSGQGHPTPSRG